MSDKLKEFLRGLANAVVAFVVSYFTSRGF
jgi:hypothetical protein